MPLHLDALCFDWPDGTPLVRDLDLSWSEGKVHALVGPSGCGKSSLLRIVAGLLPPTTGHVVRPEGPQAFVFQKPTLLPWRTLRENVALPGELGQEIGEVQAALSAVGLGEDGDKLPDQLSGGMQMRASLARALVTRPALLLLDEAFSALDPLTRRRMHQEFLGLWRARGFTVLMVSHDIDEALLLSDTVTVLAGPPTRVLDVLEVDLPRPRTPEMAHAPALVALARRIEGLL